MEFQDQNQLTTSLETKTLTTTPSRHVEMFVRMGMFQEESNAMMEMQLTGTGAAPPVCLKEHPVVILTK